MANTDLIPRVFKLGSILSPTGNAAIAISNAGVVTFSGSVGYGNTTSNSTINATSIYIANSIGNNTIDAYGMVISANGNGRIRFGNATINTTITSSGFLVANATGTSNLTQTGLSLNANAASFLYIGNSTVNTTVNSTTIFSGNATSNISYTPTSLTTSANVSANIGTFVSANITSNTISVGANNLAANNGYSRLPNGLLLQWGLTQANGSTNGNVTFTVPFTSVYSVTATPNVNNSFGYVVGVNTTVIQVRCSVAANVYWTAIGTTA